MSDASKVAERFTLNKLNSIEDAIVKMATTRVFSGEVGTGSPQKMRPAKDNWSEFRLHAIGIRSSKLESKGLVDAIAADLIRLQARQLLGGLFSGLFGASGGGLFGGLFGSGSGSAAVYHAGGLVGDPAPVWLVPADVFRGGPPLHEGAYLRPDDVPAILQRGERVLNRSEPAKWFGPDKRQSAPIVLTINVTTPDAGSFRRA